MGHGGPRDGDLGAAGAGAASHAPDQPELAALHADDAATDAQPREAQPRGGARAWLRRRWRRWVCAGALALVGVVLAGWLAITRDPYAPQAGRRVSEPGAALLSRFNYAELGERGQAVAELSRFREESGWGWRSAWVHLEVTCPGDVPHRVQVIHFQPTEAKGRRPAVLISPILGGDLVVARALGRALARRGMHGAVVLKAESYFDATQGPERLERVLRTALVDRLRTLDWLEGRPDVDPARIGAMGASMGGIGTAILAAVDRRVRASVLVMAGGGLGELVVASEERRIQRYVKALEEAGWGREELARAIEAEVVSDPLRLAEYVDPSRVLFVQSRWDRAVPTARQEALWEALGRPERWVLPTGHYSAAVYFPYLVWASAEFLEERLGGAGG